MSLSHKEFNVLNAVRLNPDATQRALAERAGVSVGTANSILKTLAANRLIENAEITDEGLKALEPYKVENAVIMAAGLSSRFAPISYEKPKGLLTVRDEILIERQIRQLQEAGVPEIIVVVGYKQEYFFYLEDKLGVKILLNDEYASRNNNSTLKVAEKFLGNTFVCSSDDYFVENPFEQYVWKAYYAAEHADGATREWCIETGHHDRIVSVKIGGEDAWYMIGHAYFDREFSKRFVEILDSEYDLPQTADKLWEQIYIDNIDEFDMVMRRYPAGTIFEFDTLDELKEFDPYFLENVDSSAFDNMIEVLGCTRSEIHDVYPLKQGLTNLSCHMTTDSGEYVYRHPGIGTEELIDRGAEMAAQRIAKELGIDDTFVAGDPEAGWKISKFISDCDHLDPHDDAQLNEAMQIARRLHESTAVLERRFDFYDEAKRYEGILQRRGPIEVPGYEEMASAIEKLHRFVSEEDVDICLTHNDFFNLNLLRDDEGKVYLIDWEYAGMGDYANDFGTFVVTSQLSEEEALRALEHYFGREPADEEVRHNFALVAFAGWCWYLWALVKESEGDFVGEWLYIYYNYAKNYMMKALEMYEPGACVLKGDAAAPGEEACASPRHSMRIEQEIDKD